MSEKKCSSQVAQHYVNDLLETLEIRGNNQFIFNEFCGVLMKHDEETVKKAWKEIVFSCELPNGQMAGRLPKLVVIEAILMKSRVDKVKREHVETKREIMPEGTFSKLWDLGMRYYYDDMTMAEFDKEIDNIIK